MKSHALVGLAIPLAGCIALCGCGRLQPNSVAPAINNALPNANVVKANYSKNVAPASDSAQANDSNNAPPDANAVKANDSNNVAPDANAGPVRLARCVALKGDIEWRPDDQSAWSQAVPNLPMRQGAEISATNGGRAEIQFDDGTRLWMARGAVVTLRSLYSDADGEFTEISVRNGVVGLDPRSPRSVYKVNTPFASVDAAGPSRLRIDATQGVRICGRQGHITVQGDNGKATLNPGEALTLQSPQATYVVQRVPVPDDVDDWISSRYEHEERYRHHPASHYVPDNIALVSDDLGDYGDWRTDPQYGRVWCPHHQESGWRPYHAGHWTWVNPFGWTWVANEPWGWAPYHYGTWCHASYGWGWVPGPVHQYWSPAAVNFSEDNGNVGWCPLAPREVHYPPTLAIGFRGGDWALSFSIGACAVYYPTAHGYSEPRPWPSRYINQVTYVNNVTNINNYYGGSMINHNRAFVNRGYIPVNARYAAGASLARVDAFGGHGAYQALPRGANPVFTRGRFIGAPTGGFAAVAGPPSVRLTRVALYPTRNLRQNSRVPQAVLTRSVFHTPGAPGNQAVVRQARNLGMAAGVITAAGVATHMANRQPSVRPGIPANVQQGRPAGVAGRAPGAFNASRPSRLSRTASPSIPGSNVGRPVAISPTQRAAMQARAALGIRPRAGTTSPATNARGATQHAVNRSVAPAQPGRMVNRSADHSFATPQVAHMPRTPAPSTPRNMPQSRVTGNPVRQNAARPSGSFAPQRNPVNTHSVAPVGRTAPQERRTAPGTAQRREAVRPNTPQQRTVVRPSAPSQRSAPVRQSATPQRAERSAPSVRQSAPPRRTERPASAVHQSAPPQRIERQAQQRAQSPPPAQRSAPPQRRQERQAAPSQNRQPERQNAPEQARQPAQQQRQPERQAAPPPQNRQPERQSAPPAQNRQPDEKRRR